ncbi:MAG: ABC transporter permease [Spirochaetota bacterium]
MRKRKLTNIFSNSIGLTLTLLISFVFVILLIFFLSKSPGRTIYYFFVGPFTNPYYFGNMLNVATPLIFTGLGIAVAFKSAVFNLGGEGQAYTGALITTVICLYLPGANGYAGGILAIITACAAGALLAGLSGFFRMKWGTDELISSFLISSAVILIVNYFITGPLDDPENNLLATRAIGEQYRLLLIFKPSKLDISIVFAVLTAGAVYFFMNKSHWGYEMRMCGINRNFARYGGISVSKYLVFPMVISGGLHGIAGGVTVLGTHYRALKGMTGGMGWNGIAVALIAKNNPVAVIPAALFFAYLDAGAKAAMLHSDVTFEIAAVAQSIIFYLVTAQALYTLVQSRRKVAV